MDTRKEIYCKPENTPLYKEIKFYEKLSENARREPHYRGKIDIRSTHIKKMQIRTQRKERISAILASIF